MITKFLLISLQAQLKAICRVTNLGSQSLQFDCNYLTIPHKKKIVNIMTWLKK